MGHWKWFRWAGARTGARNRTSRFESEPGQHEVHPGSEGCGRSQRERGGVEFVLPRRTGERRSVQAEAAAEMVGVGHAESGGVVLADPLGRVASLDRVDRRGGEDRRSHGLGSAGTAERVELHGCGADGEPSGLARGREQLRSGGTTVAVAGDPASCAPRRVSCRRRPRNRTGSWTGPGTMAWTSARREPIGARKAHA